MPGQINNQTVIPPGVIRNRLVTFDPTDLTHWHEEVRDIGPREDIITHGDTKLTVPGYVMHHDLYGPAIRYWLGWSEVIYEGAPTPYLKRYVPAAHPEQNSCFAKQVTINGWKYSHKQQEQTPPGLPVRVPYAVYNRYLWRIEFGSVDYAVRADASINSEWERFVAIKPNDATELVSIPAGNYRLMDPVGVQSRPMTLNAPLLIHAVERSDFIVKVHHLPLDLIFNSYRVPIKLMKAKGKVNKTEWLGYAAQTVLIQKYEWEIYPMPVQTESWDNCRFGLNLMIHCSYQEPTKKYIAEPLAGWNLAPATDRLRESTGWYGTRTPSGKPMYSHCEFNNLITHWSINDLGIGQP